MRNEIKITLEMAAAPRLHRLDRISQHRFACSAFHLTPNTVLSLDASVFKSAGLKEGNIGSCVDTATVTRLAFGFYF